MLPNEVERLKHEYAGRHVALCDDAPPEWARFHGAVGVVKTINMNGAALVEFDVHHDHGWYDIATQYLRFAEPKASHEKKTASHPCRPAHPSHPCGGPP